MLRPANSRQTILTPLLITLSIAGTVLLGLIFSRGPGQRSVPLATSVAQIVELSADPAVPVFQGQVITATPTEIPPQSPTPPSGTLVPSPTPRPSDTPAPATPAGTPTAVAVLQPACGQVPSGWVPHTVQLGDSLFRLALDTGATVNEIRQANCIENGAIFAGTVIYLPSTPPERIPCFRPPDWVEYVVQPGDTMYSLARARGTTVYAIKQGNCFTSSRLFSGRIIFLPAAAVAPPTSVPPTAVPPTNPPPPSATPAPPTATFTPAPPTATFTPAPPTATFTPAPPTATFTPAPPTATFTPAPPTATFTPAPPTATFTPAPPTATFTPAPPTATFTPMPPTATFTPVPSATPTPEPPTATPTPEPPTDTPSP